MNFQEYLTSPKTSGHQTSGPAALMQLLVLWEREAEDVQATEAVSQAVLEAIAVEPLALLPPASWKLDRPRLRLQTAFRDQWLEVTASPAEEGSTGEGDQSKHDVVAPASRQTVLILRIDVGQLLQCKGTGPLRRKVLFEAYQEVVRQVSLVFDCTLCTALVCFGAQSTLAIRDLERPRADLRIAGNEGTPPWHPDLARLCHAAGLRASEAVEFFRETLQNLDPKERVQTLAHYCGHEHCSIPWRLAADVKPELLLQVLEIVNDPLTYPPLAHQDPEASGVLRRMLEEHGETGLIEQLRSRYALCEDSAWRIVREQLPEDYMTLPRALHQLIAEISELHVRGLGESPMCLEFRKHLCVQAQCIWDDFPMRRDARLREVVRHTHMKQSQLAAWAEARAPEFAHWLQAQGPQKVTSKNTTAAAQSAA